MPFAETQIQLEITILSKVSQKEKDKYHMISLICMGFPGGTSGKEPACLCSRCKRPGFDSWVRKIPWRREWEPTPVFLPGESHGQRSLEGYSP